MTREITLVYRGVPYSATSADEATPLTSGPGITCKSYKFLGRSYTRCDYTDSAMLRHPAKGLRLRWLGNAYAA